jgi:hypothetical protein
VVTRLLPSLLPTAIFFRLLLRSAALPSDIKFYRSSRTYHPIHTYCTPVQDHFVTSTKFIIMSQLEGDSEAEERTLRWNRALQTCCNRRIKHINALMRNDRERDERELASLAPSSHLTKPVCPCFQLLDDEGPPSGLRVLSLLSSSIEA